MRPRGEHLVTAEKKPERRVEKNKGVRKRETEGVRRRSGWFLVGRKKKKAKEKAKEQRRKTKSGVVSSVSPEIIAAADLLRSGHRSPRHFQSGSSTKERPL